MEKKQLQFAAMLGDKRVYAKGMRGDCSNTVKAVGGVVAGAVGGMIAGPIGAGLATTIFNEAWETGSELINGQPYSVPTFQDMAPGMNNPQFQVKDQFLGQTQQNDRFETLNTWFFEVFKPWAESYFNEDEFQELPADQAKTKVNEIILNLEALRLMYKVQAIEKGNELAGTQLGNGNTISAQIDINGSNPDGMVEFESLRTKSDAFAFLSDLIKDIFLKSMDNQGQSVFTKTIENFDPNRYDINEPESITYSNIATTDVELFVFTPGESISIDYTDGESQSANDQAKKPETAFVSTNKNYKYFGVAGLLIALPWTYKKLFNSAKKKK